MSYSARFDYAATIKKAGIVLFESDLEIAASVLDDDECTVIIDDIILSQWSDKVKFNLGNAADAFCVALFSEIKETLESDVLFVATAQEAAGLVYVGLGGNDPDGHFKALEAAE